MFKKMKKMVKDEEGAGILGCLGGAGTLGVGGAALGGISGVIISGIINILAVLTAGVAGLLWPMIFGGFAVPWMGLAAAAPIWSFFGAPIATVLALAGGAVGALVGMFSGCLSGICADWMGTCGIIASTCNQAIGRIVGGLFGAMGK